MGSITNFPNGLASFGVPIVGGGLPPAIDGADHQIYYFVDKLRGYDGAPADSPERASDNIIDVITKVNASINWSGSPWAPRKVIVIAPGKYEENITSLPYGAVMVGLGNAWDLDGENGVTIKPASGSPVNVTSMINMLLENICFESPDTSPVFQVDNFNRNVMRNCVIAGLPGASPTTTRGFEVVKDMTGNLLLNLDIRVCRNGIYIVTDNANSKQASGNLIKGCMVRGADQTGIHFDANCVPSMTLVDDCIFGDGSTTLALGVDDDSDLVAFSNCMIRATANDPISGAGKYNNCYLNGALIT
jgi:hypothetical protein